MQRVLKVHLFVISLICFLCISITGYAATTGKIAGTVKDCKNWRGVTRCKCCFGRNTVRSRH